MKTRFVRANKIRRPRLWTAAKKKRKRAAINEPSPLAVAVVDDARHKSKRASRGTSRFTINKRTITTLFPTCSHGAGTTVCALIRQGADPLLLSACGWRYMRNVYGGTCFVDIITVFLFAFLQPTCLVQSKPPSPASFRLMCHPATGPLTPAAHPTCHKPRIRRTVRFMFFSLFFQIAIERRWWSQRGIRDTSLCVSARARVWMQNTK